MRFAAPVWPFQWNPPYEDAIRRMAGLGFRQVELIAWNREALSGYYTPARLRELRSLMSDLGVSVSEFVSSAAGMASLDRGEQDACVDHFRRMCDTARELDTGIVNTVCPTPFGLRFPPLKQLPTAQLWSVDLPEGLDWQRGWEAFVETTRRVVAVVEEAGLKYAMEPHPYRYVSSAVGMLRLLDHVPSPALGMNFDPSHLFPCGDLPQVTVYQLAGRIFHCHFSDNDALTNAHWRPGMGKIDWQAVLKALADTCYDGAISIELEDVPGVAGGPRPTAGPEFDAEMRLSREYLVQASQGLGIVWD
jgi:sugar phosphate isomerase/epimerase